MKWYGEIAYFIEREVEPGVTENDFIVRPYYGDVGWNNKNQPSAGQVNENFKINNQISVLADQFAFNNFHKIAFVTYFGSKWKVSSIEANPPRLVLYLGDPYATEDGEFEGGCGCDGKQT